MFKRSVLFVFAALLIFSLGCEKLNGLVSGKKKGEAAKAAPADIKVKGTIVARVNNTPITLEELNQDIETYNNMVPADKPEAKITTREQKINYLKNEMIRRALLYQEAQDRGLDRNQDVADALEKTRMELMIVELVRNEAGKVDASSKEIEDYYNTYKEQLKEPQERRVREIVVPAEKEANDILVQLLQGGDFASLAKQYSKSPSSKEGGDLGWLQPGKKFVQFDTVAFSDTLEQGKVSNIFKGPQGYYILKIEDIRGGKQKSLSELWDDIKRGLIFLKQQQRLEELLGKLSRDAKIEVYESQIK